MMSPEHCSWHPLFQQNVSSSTFLPCDSQQDLEWRTKWRTRYLCVVPSLSGCYGLTCGPFNFVVDLPIWGWSHCRCNWHRGSHIEQIRPQSDIHGIFIERRCLDTDVHGDHVKVRQKSVRCFCKLKSAEDCQQWSPSNWKPACLNFRQLQTGRNSCASKHSAWSLLGIHSKWREGQESALQLDTVIRYLTSNKEEGVLLTQSLKAQSTVEGMAWRQGIWP